MFGRSMIVAGILGAVLLAACSGGESVPPPADAGQAPPSEPAADAEPTAEPEQCLLVQRCRAA